VYADIVRGKDLTADILPPPAYIVESYLVTLQIATEKHPEDLDKLIERLPVLKSEFHARHAHWTKDLPEGAMRQTMLVASFEPAVEFYRLTEQQFLPLVRAGKTAEAQALLNGEMRVAFERHRARRAAASAGWPTRCRTDPVRSPTPPPSLRVRARSSRRVPPNRRRRSRRRAARWKR
jgi:hypothetical protein